MLTRETIALLLALVTLAAIAGAFLYATREARSERRHQNRGERERRRKNEDRIIAKRRESLADKI